jgi:hypothetical protein
VGSTICYSPTANWCSVYLPSTVRVAADPVGLCRRCPSLPSFAWYDQRPFSLFAVDGAPRLALALAAATVEGADEVSVSLQQDGPLVAVAVNDQGTSTAEVAGRRAATTLWPPLTTLRMTSGEAR